MKENLEIAMDNPGGGNCMFYALSHQLESVGTERSHEELRQDIVQYLRSNNVLQGRDGQIDFRSFIHGYSSWEEYLQSMSNDGEWGDNLVLIAASNMFEIPIQIVSSLPNHDPIMITPIRSRHIEMLHLGHITELHYVSLSPVRTDDVTELCHCCGTFTTNYTCSCDYEDLMCEYCGLFHRDGQCKN